MTKERGTTLDEQSLIGKTVTVYTLDRDAQEWDHVRLASLDEKSAMVEWESRGVIHQSMIPRSNIHCINVRYKNGAVVEKEDSE
jgi:hypothetical protein